MSQDTAKAFIEDFIPKGEEEEEGGEERAAAAAVDTAAADAALIAVLTAAGGQIERPKLSPAYLRYAAQQNWTTDQREPIRKLLISDAYVADTEKRGLIVLNGTGKGATLILNPDAVAAA